MNKYLCLSLALAAALGLSTSRVLAHDGHDASHAHHVSHPQASHDDHHGDHFHRELGPRQPAVLRGWYGRHRGAWGYGEGGFGWGNPWAIGTFDATANWLGLEDTSPIAGNYGTVPSVYTSGIDYGVSGDEQLANTVNDNPLPGDRALADSVNDNPSPGARAAR